jgi:C-terminal processing protease CtpA/Prc
MSLRIHYDDLTEEHRKQIGSNKGIYISLVVKDTPAFYNDLISGDIIRRVDNIEVKNRTHFGNLLEKRKHKTIEFEIWRDGKTISKQIQLNLDYQREVVPLVTETKESNIIEEETKSSKIQEVSRISYNQPSEEQSVKSELDKLIKMLEEQQ